MATGQLLGLDVGQKRTGIARASSVVRLAEPLATVPTEELIDYLKKLIAETGADTVVVGLPRSLNGEETEQTRWVRDWLKAVKGEFSSVKFHLQDEALTTELARERAGKKITEIDAEAAAIILQDFLDAREVKV